MEISREAELIWDKLDWQSKRRTSYENVLNVLAAIDTATAVKDERIRELEQRLSGAIGFYENLIESKEASQNDPYKAHEALTHELQLLTENEKLRAELEQVKKERDDAVELLGNLATYLDNESVAKARTFLTLKAKGQP
jgi:tRNA U34 5-carboxymethylaminomethyl modifying GTPase MnmE/TrmE